MVIMRTLSSCPEASGEVKNLSSETLLKEILYYDQDDKNELLLPFQYLFQIFRCIYGQAFVVGKGALYGVAVL